MCISIVPSVGSARAARARGHAELVACAGRRAAVRALLFASVALAGCGSEPTGPDTRNARLSVFAGDGQFGEPGATLAEPLAVRVTSIGTGAGIDELPISWRHVEGIDVTITPIDEESDVEGVARANVRLSSALGSAIIEAAVGDRADQRVTFEVRAVAVPAITSVTPAVVVAGEPAVITGSNFSAVASENTVRFGAFEAVVESASPTQLAVRAPDCLPGREVELSVALGAVASQGVDVETVAGAVDDLVLEPGSGFTTADPTEMSCIRVPGESMNVYLVATQNSAPGFAADLSLALRGVTLGSIVTAPPAPPVSSQLGSDFELRLRDRERAFEGAFVPATRTGRAAVLVPQVGDRRQFRVLTANDEIETTTAEVVAVTQRAVLYEDLDAPAGGLTADDFTTLGAIFDDPIYPTVTSAFGTPSDIDANQRVIILFTPRVNRLTPRNQNSFIVGFFFGCDLVPADECSQTNGSEIFYSIVPDPNGEFGDPRSRTQVRRTVPSVLAHEFQHMISFVARNQSLDDLWLSEALAHAAEDIVAEEFEDRGDAENAERFRSQNLTRAARYLDSVRETPLVTESGSGSLEVRGGAWLLVKYLMGHYGGTALLGELTSSDETGTDNIAASTDRPWASVFAEFGIALWADDAPELAGVPVEPRFTFTNLDMHATFGGQNGYPLEPAVSAFGDFAADLVLPPGSEALRMLRHDAGGPAPPPLHLALTRRFGGFGTNEHPGLAILRIR